MFGVGRNRETPRRLKRGKVIFAAGVYVAAEAGF